MLLGIRILMVCFESQLNSEWFRIARTIREMDHRLSQHQENNGPLWRFLDFIATHRSPLYSLLLPFIHTRLFVSSDDSDVERHFQMSTKEKIAGSVISGGKSKTLLLAELGNELGELRTNLNKRLQGELMFVDMY